MEIIDFIDEQNSSNTTNSRMSSSSNMMHIFSRLNSQLEIANLINMYAMLIFTLLGFVGNMSALAVLFYARHKQPRISDSSYLIILTLSNTGFLLVHFYMSTYIRIIHNFNLDYKSFFQYYTTNQIACKMLNYLRYAFRFLSSFLTVCFCAERLLAVYFPLKVRSLSFNFSLVYKICVPVSFLLPLFSFFLFEIVPTNTNYYNNLNISKVFNHKSLAPILGDHSCLTPLKNIKMLLKCMLVTFTLIFLSYVFVSASTIAIIFKIRRANKFVFEYWTRDSETRKPTSVKVNKPVNKLGEVDEPMLPQDSAIQKQKSVQITTSKAHDTRLLSSISACFVLLNAPYFIGFIRLIIYLIFKKTPDHIDDIDFTVENMIYRLKFQIFILIGEIFQQVNFSVTGLLLYFSGRAYREHAASLLKHIFSCFK